MILTSHQPYFFPYLGYWQLIHAADRFLIGDDYAYMTGSWIPRNRILVNGRTLWFRVPIDHASCHRDICDTFRAPEPVDTTLLTLEMAYHKAPFFAQAYPVAERILRNPERNLALFLEHSIREICAYLGITTPVSRTSDLPGNRLLRREERIYDFCRRVGADTYINAIGGRTLYDGEAFARQGLRLQFLHSRPTPYPQFGGPFAENLSVLDAMMFLSREQLHERLDEYDLVDG